MRKAISLIIVVGLLVITLSACSTCEHEALELPALLKPTCTEQGVSGGTICSKCGEILIPSGGILAPTGHQVIVEPNIEEPTCHSTGLSGITHCANCGEILSNSDTIPMLNHNFDYKGYCCNEDCSYHLVLDSNESLGIKSIRLPNDVELRYQTYGIEKSENTLFITFEVTNYGTSVFHADFGALSSYRLYLVLDNTYKFSVDANLFLSDVGLQPLETKTIEYECELGSASTLGKFISKDYQISLWVYRSGLLLSNIESKHIIRCSEWDSGVFTSK